MFALELQRRSDAAGWNLTSDAAHPRFSRTNLFASGPGGLLSVATDFAAPFFGHSAADGARPILFAATSRQSLAPIMDLEDLANCEGRRRPR